jgi:hypothetical protein
MTIDQEYKIAKRMEKYKESEFRLYLDETGWEDWMDEFASDEEPTESEIKKIEKIQKDIWWMVFN